MDSTWVSSILLMGFDTASEELSPDNFGLITFRSFVAGMLLFRNSNNLSSLLFSVRATLGGVLVPEGGRRDLMGTVGPPECRKKLVTSSFRKQLTFHNPTTGFPKDFQYSFVILCSSMTLTHNFEDVLLSVATKMPREMTCIYNKVYSAWCSEVGGGRRTGLIIVTLPIIETCLT